MSQELENLVLLTVKQAATALQLSEGTIWNLFGSGQLPYVKIRGARRIRIDDIKRLAKDGTQM